MKQHRCPDFRERLAEGVIRCRSNDEFVSKARSIYRRIVLASELLVGAIKFDFGFDEDTSMITNGLFICSGMNHVVTSDRREVRRRWNRILKLCSKLKRELKVLAVTFIRLCMPEYYHYDYDDVWRIINYLFIGKAKLREDRAIGVFNGVVDTIDSLSCVYNLMAYEIEINVRIEEIVGAGAIVDFFSRKGFLEIRMDAINRFFKMKDIADSHLKSALDRSTSIGAVKSRVLCSIM